MEISKKMWNMCINSVLFPFPDNIIFKTLKEFGDWHAAHAGYVATSHLASTALSTVSGV